MPARRYRVGRSATGLGLFAIKPIKKNEYIATYRGRKVDNDEANRLDSRGSKYLFELNSLWTIDGSPRWNIARYINHSCRPNAKPVGRRGGIVFRAMRLIEPGEEITFDYGKTYYRFFVENGGCRCSPCKAKAARKRKEQRAQRAARKRRQPGKPSRRVAQPVKRRSSKAQNA
jgi:SET domain-containing protein